MLFRWKGTIFRFPLAHSFPNWLSSVTGDELWQNRRQAKIGNILRRYFDLTHISKEVARRPIEIDDVVWGLQWKSHDCAYKSSNGVLRLKARLFLPWPETSDGLRQVKTYHINPKSKTFTKDVFSCWWISCATSSISKSHYIPSHHTSIDSEGVKRREKIQAQICVLNIDSSTFPGDCRSSRVNWQVDNGENNLRSRERKNRKKGWTLTTSLTPFPLQSSTHYTLISTTSWESQAQERFTDYFFLFQTLVSFLDRSPRMMTFTVNTKSSQREKSQRNHEINGRNTEKQRRKRIKIYRKMMMEWSNET